MKDNCSSIAVSTLAKERFVAYLIQNYECLLRIVMCVCVCVCVCESVEELLCWNITYGLKLRKVNIIHNAWIRIFPIEIRMKYT